MISGYLQVGIVAIIVGLLVCLISVLRKLITLDRIMVAVLLCSIGITALCFGFGENKTQTQEVVMAENQVAADRYFASKYAENGAYREALELLAASTAGNVKITDMLMLARLSVLNHAYSQAKLYYEEYLDKKDDSQAKEEWSFVSYYLGGVGDAQNGVIQEYLSANNLTAAQMGWVETPVVENISGFEDEAAFSEAVLNRVISAAKNELEDMEDDKEVKSVGDDICFVNACLDAYNSGEVFEDEELEKCANELNKVVRGQSDLANNINVRNAALTANALLGNAESVAVNINENADMYELAVATELFVNGYVSEKSFKNLSTEKVKKAVLNQVQDRCKEIAKADRDSAIAAEMEKLESAIELLQSGDKDYVLKNILYLSTKQADVLPYREKSKSYLEIAKGFDYTDMDEMMNTYIDMALESAEASDDARYATAMVGLLDFISGKNGDNARGVSGLAKDALADLMPVPMERFEEKKAESGTETPAPEQEAVEDFDFEGTFTEKVTQKKSVINIGQIEKEQFPIITTRLSFGEDIKVDANNIKDKINIYDCGYPITKYEVRKVDNLTGKIVLLCDMSGSMSGSEGDLREAVTRFADGMSKDEKVSVVGFSSYIEFQSDFLGDPAEVKEYAGRIRASGGTSVYPTILAAAEMFSDDVNDNNIIVVMTDGQDGSRPSDTELNNRLREIVAKHNCTIYTVGIGGADDAYLKTIAELGNGQYLFVDSADKLSSFYEFMHAQIANSYVVTYAASDTVKNERTLEVEAKESIGSAIKTYYLNEEAVNDHDTYADDLFDIKNADGLQVYGLSATYMYTSKSDVPLSLYGENFKEDEKYDIKLVGSLRKMPINYKYVSDRELEVTIPYTMAVGVYSLELSSETASCTVKKALTVAAPSSLRQFKFGSYVFTCEKAVDYGDGIILSDNVIMNGWLHFKGDLEFIGDSNDQVSQYINMKDESGSYVKYSRNGSTGFTKFLANMGISIPVPKFGTITLYSEPYKQSSYKSFPVQKITLNAVVPINGLADVGGSVALYPDMIYSEAFYTQLDLKYLDNVLKNLPKNMFSHNVTGALAFTNSSLVIDASYEFNYEKDNDPNKEFQIGKMGFYVKKLGFDLDTIKDEYSIEGEVGFKAFKMPNGTELSGAGLKLGWSGNRLDELELSAAVKMKLTETPVPLTLSQLSLGAKNLASVNSVADLLGVTIEGGFNLGAADVIERVPKKVKDFFDLDTLYLAELDDAKISVTLGEFNLAFESDVKLLGIKLAKGKIELGKIDYTNAVLNIQATEIGADVDLYIGVSPSWKNLDAKLGGDARVTLGYPFGGLTLKGEVGYDLRWFLFSWGKDLYGDFGIGLYWNSNKEVQFIVKAYGQNEKGKASGFRVDVSPSMGVKKVKY